MQTSEKCKVYFSGFHSECNLSSQLTAKVVTNERDNIKFT